MKIVIAGIGKVGMTLSKQLAAARHDVVVIDQNEDRVQSAVNTYDLMGVVGNGASLAVLQEAGIEGADLLIATTSSDEVNILCCLVGKKLGVPHIIARLRDPEYERQFRVMRDDLGLSMIINPEEATAREIARILRFPSAVKLESFSKGRIELVEYHVEAGTPLSGVRLSDLYKNVRSHVLICVVLRGSETVIPSGDFVLEAGDRIFLSASPQELEQFFRRLGLFKSRAHSAMIVGASRIGYYLGEELIETGTSVKIIDLDEKKCVSVGEHLPKAMVIRGDGTDFDLLKEEGIASTDAFIAITGIDEANILMAFSAARNSSCKVIAKINHESLAALVSEEHMIDSIVSTGSITAELILQFVRALQNASGSQVKTLHRIADGAAEALEFTVTEDIDFVNTPLSELSLKKNVLIGGIVRRDGEIIIPSGQDMLYPNDDVIVVTTHNTLQDLRDILK